MNEDKATDMVENTTRGIPPLFFIGAAVVSMGISAALMWSRRSVDRERWSSFIAQWVPSLLVLGTYNRIARTFPKAKLSGQNHSETDHPLGYDQAQTRVQPETSPRY